jgi:5-methylcytosine-specific restriction protein B
MPFLPNNITRDHVLQAVAKIQTQNLSLKKSTGYDVVINGENFPPKEVMRYAHEVMNGERIWEYSGGEPTTKYLQEMGFLIIEKKSTTINELISKYKTLISQTKLNDELYKWRLIKQFKGLPDLQTENFHEHLNTINYGNLLYKMARAVLNDLSNRQPEELRKCFVTLFDENINLGDRILSFSETTLRIYREWMTKLSHHQDERTMSVYLSFYNPEKYAIYKYSFYSKYCALIGETKPSKGHRYVHYLDLLNDFIDEYIRPDLQLIELANSFKTDDCYDDPNLLLLAQDILFQMFEKDDSQVKYWAGGFNFSGSDSQLASFFDEGIWQMGWSPEATGAKNFYKLMEKISEGDYIALKTYGGVHTLTLYGLGRVIDVSNAEEGQLGVEWLIKEQYYKGKAPIGSGAGNWQGTLLQVTRAADIKQFFTDPLAKDDEPQNIPDIKINHMHPLNQVLYGPPGTGKTYNSINHALAIVEGKTLATIEIENKINRQEVLRRFQTYIDSDQVVFTTFHQSMSYEDFIEGIKPVEADEQLNYEVQSGLFKTLAESALANLNNAKKGTGRKSFEAVWEQYLTPLNEEASIPVKMKKSSYTIFQVNDRTIFFDKNSGESKHTLSVKSLKSMYDAGGNQVIKGGLQPYYEALLGQLLKLGAETGKAELKNYVIIIDEINRGNVAQIFGELITLIEQDKRIGNNEALTVTLPYSKKKGFGIPSNLYIIGTMNTADRSVEALDTALRRRFRFIEMPPRYDLADLDTKIDDISLKTLLSTLNSRIEKLLDKDHLIGHSYFLQVKNTADLSHVFHQNIVPLLQEYFYGDFAKIGLVLGEAFFEKSDETSKTTFARFKHDAIDELKDRAVYRLKQEWTESEFAQAIAEMINP